MVSFIQKMINIYKYHINILFKHPPKTDHLPSWGSPKNHQHHLLQCHLWITCDYLSPSKTKAFTTLRSLTLPETNIAPENRPSQKETIVFQPSISRCKLLVSGRVPPSATLPGVFGNGLQSSRPWCCGRRQGLEISRDARESPGTHLHHQMSQVWVLNGKGVENKKERYFRFILGLIFEIFWVWCMLFWTFCQRFNMCILNNCDFAMACSEGKFAGRTLAQARQTLHCIIKILYKRCSASLSSRHTNVA